MRSWLPHIALSLCVMIGLNILAIPLTYLDFRLRQDYYASVLCENQDQPIAVCGGRCFVDKQIAQMQPQNQSTTNSLPSAPVLKIDLEVYIVTTLLDFHPVQYTLPALAYPKSTFSVFSDYIDTVFRPPRV